VRLIRKAIDFNQSVCYNLLVSAAPSTNTPLYGRDSHLFTVFVTTPHRVPFPRALRLEGDLMSEINGFLLSKRYRLDAEIGRGGMGGSIAAMTLCSSGTLQSRSCPRPD
jgi:hypothetical protein